VATPIAGRKGRIYGDISTDGTGAAVPIANLNSYSLNASTDKIEVTSFGDTSKSYVVSLPDAQGDLSGFWDTDGDQYKLSKAIDGGRKFYLYPTTDSATKYWFGKAFFDVSVNSTVSGAVEVSGSWAIASSLQDHGISA
jgi:hypothetical protein